MVIFTCDVCGRSFDEWLELTVEAKAENKWKEPSLYKYETNKMLCEDCYKRVKKIFIGA